MTGRHRRASGFTLLEVVLAVGLMVILTGTLFAFYNTSLRTRAEGLALLRRGELAWSLLRRIEEDIRSANGFAPGLGPGISGYRHEIKLQTVTLPDKELFERRSIRERPLPAMSDVREVRYYLAIDPEQTETYRDPELSEGAGVAYGEAEVGVEGPATLGIVRREVKTLRQDSPFGQRTEQFDVDLISQELRYLRFRYFDGVDWVDIWQPPQGGLGNSLPQAVEVTVGWEPELPQDPTELDLDELEVALSQPEPYRKDRYSVVVRLNQADVFLGSRLIRASKRAFGGGSSKSN